MRKSKQRPKAKLKKYPNGGKLNPYIATDPNDPRIQNYKDSLMVSRASDRDLANVTKDNTIDYDQSMKQTMTWNSGPLAKAHGRLSKISPTKWHEAEYYARPTLTGSTTTDKFAKASIAKYPAPKQQVIYQPPAVVSKPTPPPAPVATPISTVKTDMPATVTYGKSPMGHPYRQTGGNKTFLTQGEADKIPYFQYANGGLKRSEDYGSEKKPYPTVQANNFAGGNRSYPIPTKADAIDALRLAGLHGRSDVKSKVFSKYPSLKKHENGGEFAGGNKTANIMKDTGLFIVDNALSEWAPNAIKESDYSDSGYSQTLAKVTAIHEALDSQSPIQKNLSKYGGQDPNANRSAESQEYYDKALPIAKTGSKIGEMYATQGVQSTMQGKQQPEQVQSTYTDNIYAGDYMNPNSNINVPQNPETYNPSDPNRDETMYGAYGGIKYPHGGIHSGMPNAEVETIETMNTAPGSITSANSNKTHAMGGVNVNLPTGTKMLSDRIKNPETGNTFAKDGNKYTTTKEDKVKNDINSTGIAKFTANLKSQTKQFMHDKLFQAQEAIKQAKLKLGMQRLHKKLGIEMPQHQMPDDSMMNNSEMKMGGKMCYPDGGTKLPQYYDAGLTPMEVPEDPKIRTQQDWYFPKPSYNTPGFAMPQNPNTPMLTRAERDQAEWERMDAAGRAGEQAANAIPVTPSTPDTSDYAKQIDNDIASGVYKAPDSSERDYSSMRDAAGLGANILGQNAGNIWDAYQTRMGTKYDKEASRKLRYNRLDPTQALNDADIQNKITRGALAGAAGGNAGAYMGNAIQAGAQNSLAKARVRAEYEKYNAAIGDKEQSENLGLERLDKANEQANKARSEDIARTAISSMGQNTSSAMRDYKLSKRDQQSLDLISQAYPDYTYDKKKNAWFHKSNGKKLVI